MLGHLIDTCTQISGLLHGRPTSPLTDVAALQRLTGDNPTHAWARAHHTVLDALADTTAQVIKTGRGPLERGEVLLTVTVEPLVHGWDLAQALDQHYRFDPEVVEALLPGVLALGPDLAATGMYDPALDVAASAPPHERLLATLGRNP